MMRAQRQRSGAPPMRRRVRREPTSARRHSHSLKGERLAEKGRVLLWRLDGRARVLDKVERDDAGDFGLGAEVLDVGHLHGERVESRAALFVPEELANGGRCKGSAKVGSAPFDDGQRRLRQVATLSQPLLLTPFPFPPPSARDRSWRARLPATSTWRTGRAARSRRTTSAS